MSTNATSSARQDYDAVIQQITDFVVAEQPPSPDALATARLTLLDATGCGLQALQFPACTKLLGPLVEGTIVPHGARVPGTPYRLDPMMAAFNIGCINRWLDYNDAWIGAEWGHPSDNLAGILAVSDHLSQRAVARGEAPLTMRDVLEALTRAYEIQGTLALVNSFNRVGLDHVLLVRLASTAVLTRLMGGEREEVLSALSHAWVDGSALRTYRHAPNTGSRKSWAAGDAASRAVRLADIAMRGEMGVPQALTAEKWGFQDTSFSHTNADLALKSEEAREVRLDRDLGCHVMENILFKVGYPAEFHGDTAIEAGIVLHPLVRDRLDDIRQIVIHTQEAGVRIISKQGPLDNPADRDHCLEYLVALALIFGEVTADQYEDVFHQSQPEIDQLRDKMVVQEDPRYSADYLDPDVRSIANRLQIAFSDGSRTDDIEVEFPLGHRRRRDEATPILRQKFERSLALRFPPQRCEHILAACEDQAAFESMPVHEFTELFAM